jgi:hypothetical protein
MKGPLRVERRGRRTLTISSQPTEIQTWPIGRLVFYMRGPRKNDAAVDRIFLGIPTKKGKPPRTPTWKGTVRATLRPGTIGYGPSPPFQFAMETGTKTQLRLLAEPVRPEMICRTLLKIGFEVVANDTRRVNRRVGLILVHAPN